MALTNSERQKRFREKRNELAKRASATVDPLADRLRVAFRNGALKLLRGVEGEGGTACAAEISFTYEEIRRRRLTEAILVEMAEKAGETAASQIFIARCRETSGM